MRSGRQDATVLDAVAGVHPWHLPLRVAVGVEAHLDGAVADRVDRHLPTVAVAVEHDLVQLLLRHHLHAEVVRLRVFEEWLAHGGGSADQRAVGEQLERADAQAVVAEPRAQAGVAEGREHRPADHHRGAERVHRALAPQLVGSDLVQRVDTGRVAGRNAGRNVAVVAGLQRVDQLVDGGLGNDSLHQGLRRLEQQAGRLAVAVADDLAALRGLGRAGDPGAAERLRVRDCEVPGAVDEEDRVLGAAEIEIDTARVALLGKLVVVVATRDDPAPRRSRSGALADRADQRGDRADRGGPGVDRREAAPVHDHVVVGLDEARKEDRAPEIDLLGAGGRLPAQRRAVADGDDAVTIREHRLRGRRVVVHRDDGAVGPESCRHAVVVSFVADRSGHGAGRLRGAQVPGDRRNSV